MDSLPKAVSARERGAALVIVLAFVVLFTVLVVAYLSRTTGDRQVAHGSFNQSKADQFAASAMNNIIGDLRQEITNGSTATTVNGATIHTPTSAANMIPQRSGNAAGVPNLIRRSVSPDNIVAPGLPSRASAVNSTTAVSANGRFITSARWNSHYLVPKGDTTTADPSPIPAFTAATPDWVFVTSDPSNQQAGRKVIGSPDPLVIGRYAYAIYDEGGLLDMNLAGYPTGTTVAQSSGKRSLAFADLTALPSVTPIPNVNFIVGWRNYATTQAANSFPNTVPAAQAFANNLSSPTPATNFYNFVVSNPWGPLAVRSDPSPSPYPWNGRTDQMFLSRQELIAFQKTPNANNGTPINNTNQFGANALQYLGTFSRETAAGAPQWTGPSPTPTTTNPNFQTLLVTTPTTPPFTRNDGTTANVGDPLVNKPFLLQRLNWLTYKGPSATRTLADADMSILINTYTSAFGATTAAATSFLQQGTATNIQKYFGLVWDTTNERWNYVGQGSSLLSSIADLGTLTGTREPDFFELLKAGILDYSLGDSYSPISALPTVHQQYSPALENKNMLHILTIGANLIAQSRADSYPVRVACTVGSATMEAIGAPRLPYLNSLAACPVAGTSTSGGINWFLVPNLWDPFRNTWNLTEPSGTPLYPRPLVRISVTGSVAFGTKPYLASDKSGYLPSATPFSSPILAVSPTPASLPLATATPSGRDGLLEASRLAPTDISGSVTTFTPTTVPASAGFAWNSIPYPSPSPAGGTNFIAFRISLPGTNVPASTITPTQNPVLILKSGFQMTLDYQSPNGTWYSYSFLQGNNATNTWISADLNLTTVTSKYGTNPSPSPMPTPSPSPTILLRSTGVATPWAVTTLADAPMFAKADPRSIRYNSQIGVVNLTSPPTSTPSAAGIIGSIWPDAYQSPTYTAPPVMTTASASNPTPTPTPTPSPAPTPTPTPPPPNANPAIYSQVSWSGVPDNAPAGSNPYSENNSNLNDPTRNDRVRPVMMNRPFRSVGEMAYAFRDQPFRTLSFSSGSSSNPSPDAALLELFSVNNYPTPSPTPTPSSIPTPTPRAGVINLNSRQSGAIAAMLAGAIQKESVLAPSPVGGTTANSVGTSLASLAIPGTNKGGLAALIANETTGFGPSVPKTERESIARALGEADQVRTWNLMIDVIAQSGRYPPTVTANPQAADLPKFIVEGEQRYWVHVAIDRFTGQVIDKQIEVVNE